MLRADLIQTLQRPGNVREGLTAKARDKGGVGHHLHLGPRGGEGSQHSNDRQQREADMGEAGIVGGQWLKSPGCWLRSGRTASRQQGEAGDS